MTWRVAESLEVLLEQFDTRYPNRSKASDGGIGDAAHATRTSDHNPWYQKNGMGIVTARDFTHDPAVGMDIDRLTDELAASRDPRIKYVIANGWILDSRPGNSPWQWVRYHGSNPHTKHFHLSVMPHLCDDARPWNLPSFGGAVPAPTPNPDTEDDDLKPEERQWLLDIHRFLYEAGFIQNKIDPKNKTKGADMISDMALWINQNLGHTVAARQAAEKSAHELTVTRESAVGNSDFKATMGEYSRLADSYGYVNTQLLTEIQDKVDAMENGGIDVDTVAAKVVEKLGPQIADAVADKIAERMAH